MATSVLSTLTTLVPALMQHPIISFFGIVVHEVAYVAPAMLLALQVSVKHRGFNQIMKGEQVIEFANGDVIEFLQMPCFVTKGVRASRRVLVSSLHVKLLAKT
jgi:hypothetical protein